MSKLRVEEPVARVQVVPQQQHPVPQKAAEDKDLAHWKELAIRTGERLQYAETQAADLRRAADDARARFGKYKDRLDKANERINELMTQLVTVSADRDNMRDQLANQERLARAVYDYRQSLLTGPIWNLFEELALSSPPQAGVEQSRP